MRQGFPGVGRNSLETSLSAPILVRCPGRELSFLGHSTVRVELAGRTVLTDPLLTSGVGPLRRVVAPLTPASWAGVDVVLISHLHGDHLHPASLRLLGHDVRIVVPRGGAAWLRRHGFRRVDELSAGESLSDGDLRITAVRAEHSGHRSGPRLTHGPTTESLGHLLDGAGSTVYVSGDTGSLSTALGLFSPRHRRQFLPVWGWGPPGGGGLDGARGRGGGADPAAGRRAGALGTLAMAGMPGCAARSAPGCAGLLEEPPRRVRGRGRRPRPGPHRVIVAEPGGSRRPRRRAGGGVMAPTVLADGWTDRPADRLPVIFLGVLLGSIVPVFPPAPSLGAGAALAPDQRPASTCCRSSRSPSGGRRSGRPDYLRRVPLRRVRRACAGCRAARAPTAWPEVRDQFRRHGWQIIVAGRLLPGRAGTGACSPPARWPIRGAGARAATVVACRPVGGRLRRPWCA